MNLKVLLGVFWSVFLAELGDKTQIATFCFASQKGLKPGGVFLAAASALAISSLLSSFLGAQFSLGGDLRRDRHMDLTRVKVTGERWSKTGCA
ncbi:MAG TPA: TMEM165/GDT1 family protein [Candidatus Latescibacteria bacterium]|nr:TMEM165/GDT1 family protein [Candidatus Latescibacterota bacterium]